MLYCSVPRQTSQSQLHHRIAGALFLLALDAGAAIEYWSLGKTARYFTVLGSLIAAAAWAARRTAVFAGAPHNRIQFEDVPVADIFALDLRRDSLDANEGDYADALRAIRDRSG